MERMDELLRAAAADLDDGRAPLSREFLVEHSVTSDECRDLMQRLSIVVYAYVESPRAMRNAMLIVGALQGMPGPTDAVWLEAIRKWQLELLQAMEGL